MDFELFTINQRLQRVYGRDVYVDKPRFRVVWSESATERRHGNHNEFTESGIFIRTFVGVKEVKKYFYLAAPCWVLEVLERIPSREAYDEVLQPYTYEPLMVFLNKDDIPLPLRWRPIEFTIQRWLNFTKVIKSEADFELEDQLRLQKEIQAVRESFDDSSYADSAMQGEGVHVPSKQFKQEKKDAKSNSSLDLSV